MNALRTAAILVLGIALGLALSLRTSAEPPAPKPKIGGKAHALYAKGAALAKQQKWADAHAVFVKAHAMEKSNADVLNMLAFTTRKHTKDYGKAIELYHAALAKRPKFAEAREYLAEAHIQAALKELEILRSYGKNGASQATKVANALTAAAASAGGKGGPKKNADW